MDQRPTLIASDLEGVFVPEIWQAVSRETGIEKLSLTTRDIADYDELMHLRLDLLKEHNITLKNIQDVIDTLDPLEGAKDCIGRFKALAPFIVLSDTFYEFAAPLMVKLGHPTLFCHNLQTGATGEITGYRLRLPDSKRKAVAAFKSAGFRVIAFGDSYNDTSMLGEADSGILFRAPQNVIKEFPQYPVFTEYSELESHIDLLLSK